MSILKFFKCLSAGLILACWWVMIAIIISGNQDLAIQLRILSGVMWFISIVCVILTEELFE